jgi:hypothetical protein
LIKQFISLLKVKEQDCWFQQDGAAAHTTSSVMEVLQFFCDHIILQNMWSTKSPYVIIWLLSWGFLKDKVYKNNCKELK